MDLSKQGDEEAPREKKKDARKGRKKEGDNYHEWVEIRRGEVEEQEEVEAERSRKGREAKNGQQEDEKRRKLHNFD